MAADELPQPITGEAGDSQSTQGVAAEERRPKPVKFVGSGATVEEDNEDDDDSDGEVSDDDDDDDEDDEEDDSDTYIALPDGAVAAADIENPLVSRIGGPPAFLPLRTLPPYPAITTCPNAACAEPMELLLQIFAPREQSPYDRCLHVWGCARRACNGPRASGSSASSSRPSLRVLRTLTYNPRWAAKLAKEKARREEKERAKAEQAKSASSAATGGGKNPFALQSTGAAPPAGGMLFGGDSDDEDKSEDDGDSDSEAEQAERLAEELQIKATLEEQRSIRNERKRKQPASGDDGRAADDQAWPEHAEVLAYRPPQYLNTIPEPWAADEDEKAAAAKAKAAGGLEGGKGGSEGYERQLLSGITSTFERFVERVRREPSQVLRYAWDGVPLPYAQRLALGSANSGSNTSPATTAKKAKVTVLDPPPCERCGAPRTFELQLMPNLINLLKPSLLSAESSTRRNADSTTSALVKSELDLEAEKADVGYTPLERAERARQREIARALGRAPGEQPNAQTPEGRSGPGPQPELQGRAKEIVGLGWATAWVYVCSADCCRPREGHDGDGEGGEQETWAEEWIAVEFEQL
ncbi:hypothetical protein V8E36_000778 [Tilletia maclaganii]